MIELQEDGYIPVKIGDVEKTLDLYEVYNALVDLSAKHRGKPANDFYTATVEYLMALGFPSCSHRLADAFVTAIFKTVGDLKNVAGGASKPDSPATTEQAPSASPTPNA